MDKALFFRKCSSADDYMSRAKKMPEFGSMLYFKIIKTIVLKKNDYNYFINNMLLNNEIIIKYKNDLCMDSNDIVNCIFFTQNKKEGFLIYSSGYDYARYVAFWVKGGDKNV